MDLDKILDEYDLNNEKGLLLGSIRLADLDIELINDIIREENEKIDRLGNMLVPQAGDFYKSIKKKFYTFDEFITLQNPINERNNKRYKKDLDGFFEYMQDIKPQLAIFFLDYRQPYFSDKVRHCHSYITGKSGLGKSEIMKNIAISHILRKNCSVVLIEPHGDLARQIYKSQIFLDHEQAKRLVVIDYDLDHNYTPIINIFDQIECKNENDIDRVSQEYAKALSSICSDSKSSELSYKMEMLLRFCVRVILRKKDGCLWDLQRFMTANNTDLIELGANDPNIATKDFFTDKFSQNGYKETKEAVYNRLQNLLQDTAFQNLTTGQSTVKLKDSIDKKQIIIINLSKGGIGSFASASVGKLIIAIIKIIGLQRDKTEYRIYTQVFIDEFQNYISDAISEILEELRKYNIFLTLANQFVGQDLNTDQMKSIFANTGMKIVAQTSPDNSSKIAKEISIEAEKLNNLGQGEYYLMYSNSKKVPITKKIKGIEKYLGDSFTMDKKYKTEWEALKTAQIFKYFTRIGKYTYNAPKSQQNENKQGFKPNLDKSKPRRNEQSPDYGDLSL